MSTELLTLGEAAERLRFLKRDADAYRRDTRLGPDVASYLDIKQYEEGLRHNSIRTYKSLLRKFAAWQPGLGIEDFEPPRGTDLCRAFLLEELPADAAESTRSTYHSILSDFFGHQVRTLRMRGNPMSAIRRPRKRGTNRRALPIDRVGGLISIQERRRDRIALALLLKNGLRREELRRLQFEHIDLTHREMVLVGAKGGKMPVVQIQAAIALEIEREILDRQAESSEYLLYPVKVGRRGSYPNYQTVVIAELRTRPLSTTAIHNWWKDCLDKAGLPASWKMHEMRHTAITAHARASKDPQATQKFARHASMATTFDVYGHLFDGEYEHSLENLDSYLEERMRGE